MLVIEAGVTSSYYILSAYILKFLMFIILKGENGLKVFKWEGCLKEERRHFSVFFLHIGDSSALFFSYATNIKYTGYEEAISCSLQTLVLAPIRTLSVFCSAAV